MSESNTNTSIPENSISQGNNNINSEIDIKTLAIDKINAEVENFTGGNKEWAVYKPVAERLISFCVQDERFAEVLYKTKRTLSDCCKECVKGCGNAISDIDVYTKAVKFYFPNSIVGMNITLELGEAPTEDYINKEPEKTEPKRTAAKKPKKKENKTEIKPKTSRKSKKQDDGKIQLTLF